MKPFTFKSLVLFCCLIAIATGKKKKRRSQEDFKILSKAARFLLASAQGHEESERHHISNANSKETESRKERKGQIQTAKKVPYTKQNNLKGQVNQNTIEKKLQILRLKAFRAAALHTAKGHNSKGSPKTQPKPQVSFARSIIQYPMDHVVSGNSRKANVNVRVPSFNRNTNVALQGRSTIGLNNFNGYPQYKKPKAYNSYRNTQYNTGSRRSYTPNSYHYWVNPYTRYWRNNFGASSGRTRTLNNRRVQNYSTKNLVAAPGLPRGWYLRAQPQMNSGYATHHYRDWSQKGSLARKAMISASRRRTDKANEIYLKNTRFANSLPRNSLYGNGDVTRRTMVTKPPRENSQLVSRNNISKAPFLAGVKPHYSNQVANRNILLKGNQKQDLVNAQKGVKPGQPPTTNPPTLHSKVTTMSKSQELVESLKKGGLFIVGGNEAGRDVQKLLLETKGDQEKKLKDRMKSLDKLRVALSAKNQVQAPTSKTPQKKLGGHLIQIQNNHQQVFRTKDGNPKVRLEKLRSELSQLNEKRSLKPTITTINGEQSLKSASALSVLGAAGMLYPPYARSQVPLANSKQDMTPKPHGKMQIRDLTSNEQGVAVSQGSTQSSYYAPSVSTVPRQQGSVVSTNSYYGSYASTTAAKWPGSDQRSNGYKPSSSSLSNQAHATVKRSPRYKWYDPQPGLVGKRFKWNYYQDENFYSPNDKSLNTKGNEQQTMTQQPSQLPQQPSQLPQQQSQSPQQPSQSLQQQSQSPQQPSQLPQQQSQSPQQLNQIPQQPNQSPQQLNQIPQQPNQSPQQPSQIPQQQSQSPQQPSQSPQQPSQSPQQPSQSPQQPSQSPQQQSQSPQHPSQSPQQPSQSPQQPSQLPQQPSQSPQQPSQSPQQPSQLPQQPSQSPQQPAGVTYQQQQHLPQQPMSTQVPQQRSTTAIPQQQQQAVPSLQQPVTTPSLPLNSIANDQLTTQQQQQNTQQQQQQQQQQPQPTAQSSYNNEDTAGVIVLTNRPTVTTTVATQPQQYNSITQKYSAPAYNYSTYEKLYREAYEPYARKQQRSQPPPQQQQQQQQQSPPPPPTPPPPQQQQQQQEQSPSPSPPQQQSAPQQQQQEQSPPPQPSQQQSSPTPSQQQQQQQLQSQQQQQQQQQSPQPQQVTQNSQLGLNTSLITEAHPMSTNSNNLGGSSAASTGIRLNASGDPLLQTFLDSPGGNAVTVNSTQTTVSTVGSVGLGAAETAAYAQPTGLRVGTNGDPLLNSFLDSSVENNAVINNNQASPTSVITPKPYYAQPTTVSYSNAVYPTISPSSYVLNQNSSYLEPYNDAVANYVDAQPTQTVTIAGHTSISNYISPPGATVVPEGVVVSEGTNTIGDPSMTNQYSDGNDMLAFIVSQNSFHAAHKSPLLSTVPIQEPIQDMKIETRRMPKRSSYPIVLRKCLPYLASDICQSGNTLPWMKKKSKIPQAKKRRRILELKALIRKRRNNARSVRKSKKNKAPSKH